MGDPEAAGSGDGPSPEEIDEKTYTAYLPKAELSLILNTAMDQQSQPQRNFGVTTITANNDELGMDQQSLEGPLEQALKQELMDPMDIKPELTDQHLSRSTSALDHHVDPEQLEPQQC